MAEPVTPAPQRHRHGSAAGECIAASRRSPEDRDAIDTKLVQLVGPHKRVLVIGRDTWPLSRSLSSAGCRVSVVETRLDVPAGSATFSDRVVVGDPDAMDLERTLEGAQFDAIVMVQLLEHVRNPVRMLTTLGRHLSADGCRGCGRSQHHARQHPARVSHGPIAGGPAGIGWRRPPSHWYDRAAMQRTFERAGFVITRLERHTETFESRRSRCSMARRCPAEIVAG